MASKGTRPKQSFFVQSASRKRNPFHPDTDGVRFEYGDARTLRMHIANLPVVQSGIDLLPKDRRNVCVQAGGALGVFPQYLSMFFEAVYTFEPDPVNFSVLCKNAVAANIVKMQAALTDVPGTVRTVRMRRDGSRMPFNAGCTYVDKGAGVDRYIPAVKVDDMGFNDNRVDLLCLDVEGHEIEALTGAYLTIKSHNPLIILEVNKQLTAAGRTEKELHDYLAHDLGYGLVKKLGSDQIWMPHNTEPDF